MAKLSAHGTELYRYDTLTSRYSRRSDGHTLINRGDGWKLFRKLKPDFCSIEAANKRRAKDIQFAKDNPIYTAYKAALHDEFPLSERYMANTMVETLGNDVDGLHAEMTDHGYAIDFDTVETLCTLYNSALLEQ